MSMFHFNNDKKTYCGTYKGIKVWQYGCMIGNDWYGDFYVTIPRGESKRQMKVKDSVCGSLNDLKRYVDAHLDELSVNH